MNTRKCIALFIAMLFSTICYSQTRVQSRDVKRIAGKAYLSSRGNLYEIRENVVLAKLKEGRKQVRDDIKVTRSHSFGMLEIAVPDSVDIEKYIDRLDKTGDFECVEFDTYPKPCLNANDTYYNDQWGPSHINADAAWEFTTGLPSVKVAVIELDGFELNHPDLNYGNDTYSNISVSEGVDYVSSTDHTPTGYHGTMVAGIISAKTNNGVGIAGIAGGNNCEGSKIIPYRVSSVEDITSSIYDAVSIGVKVINISLSFSESFFCNLAIDIAHIAGVTIICAIGSDNSSQIVYPASHEYTIAVGSIDRDNNNELNSNYGEGLDLVAPGVGIMSTARTNENYYYSASGTSFAAPHVSGVVALMLSVDSTLTPNAIKNYLTSTAKKINANTSPYDGYGWNQYYGYGLVDACAAIMAEKHISISGPSYICNSSTATYTINDLPANYTVNWSLTDEFGPTAPTIQSSGHTCTITNNLSKSYVGYLNAEIRYNKTPYLSKRVYMLRQRIVVYSGFYGICNYSGSSNDLEIFPNTPIWVTKGHTVHLKSPNLINKNVSYSVTTPSWWQYYSTTGEIYVTYPNVSPNNPILINIQNNPTYPNCDNSYQLVIMPNNVLPYYSLNTSIYGNEQIEVSLVETEQSDEAKSILETYANKSTKFDDWTLEVYNATSSKKIFSKVISERTYIINSVGWKSGVYIVKAFIGDQELSEKIVIK